MYICNLDTDAIMKKLFLIDGHSLIFRMYYAFMRRPMINSKGEDTSILYGFTKFILELIRREQPTHMAVMFDPPCKTFRHELCPDYKANRAAAPELVKAALDPLVEIVGALGIPVVMKPGFEADDVIGSVAKQESERGYEVYMVTPDKDLGQIVDEHIFQYKPGKGGEEPEILDREKLCAKWGISDPKQIIDILAIWGDAADNIHGVDGVGEVGAKKLVGKYGTLENIYEKMDELTPAMQRAFGAAKDHISLSKTLATIKTDIDLDGIDDKALALTACLDRNISDLFTRYEFNSLRRLLPEDAVQPVEEPEKAVMSCSEASAESVVASAKASAAVALRRTAGGRIVICCGGRTAFLDAGDKELKGLLEDASIIKMAHDIKPLEVELLKNGVSIRGDVHDIELMHYLLNPERTHKLEILAESYLGVDISVSEGSGKSAEEKLQQEFDLFSAPAEEAQKVDESVFCRECAAIEAIAPKLREELQKQGLWALYTEVEMPLVEVLANMEFTGVKVDPKPLREYSQHLSAELAKIESEAREMVDNPALNLSSPRQVGIAIYETLNLNPRAKKSGRGDYPTDEETLSDLAAKHPFIGKLLEYRGLRKLISTYLDPLPSLINPATGRIHTTFNQALTATGRLSSVKPNLQNIPIRTERGREIRKAFISGFEGGCIVSADYSQIELRLMAHLSGDPALVDGFNRGADIHADTASRIFHVPLEGVSKEQRRQAKVANFGIIYGISPFGLAKRMEIPRGEARSFIEQYFIHYPKVKEYMDGAIARCREKGYVETIFGRKRFLPDINSRNVTVRSLAERNAINAPVQGSAADIIKKAMIDVYRRMNEAGLRSRMVLQVHDELIVDVAPGELEKVREIVKSGMEGVCTLSVPLTAECGYGQNWLEAH